MISLVRLSKNRKKY